MENKCTFQVKRKKPGDKKSHTQDCGDRAAMFRLVGDITEIRMPLCDKHQQLIARNYGWKVLPELSLTDK